MDDAAAAWDDARAHHCILTVVSQCGWICGLFVERPDRLELFCPDHHFGHLPECVGRCADPEDLRASNSFWSFHRWHGNCEPDVIPGAHVSHTDPHPEAYYPGDPLHPLSHPAFDCLFPGFRSVVIQPGSEVCRYCRNLSDPPAGMDVPDPHHVSFGDPSGFRPQAVIPQP